jgi:anti-sigma regulatory factor (Ser/Thr protein kinase)
MAMAHVNSPQAAIHYAARPARPRLIGAYASTGRARLVLGVAVVTAVLLMQLATDVAGGRDSARVWTRLAFMAFEVPLLMGTLSAIFASSTRWHMSAPSGLAVGMAVATVFGCVFGVMFGLAARQYPELHMHFPGGARSMWRTVPFGILNAQFYFGLWALAFVFPFSIESARLQELEAHGLRSQAELARLRSHLDPHFMLNTLNAIAGLVTEDPREARRLLVCLGDLLRDAVQATGDRQTLGEQVSWLRRYAEILTTRHRGALQFLWEVAPECEAVVVPRLLLQPLVENAVKHGALRRADGGGQVVVKAELSPNGILTCSIEDNGPGLATDAPRDGAVGLDLVRRRLELETAGASFRLESSSGGTRSIVEINAKEAKGS